MRALLRLIHRIEDSEPIRAPAGIFDRVRTAAAEQHGGGAAAASPGV